MKIRDMNHPVAENIRNIISRKGLKQCAVAERAGYTAQELTDMLAGRRIIKVNDIPNFCRALEVGVGDIFFTEETETKGA